VRLLLLLLMVGCVPLDGQDDDDDDDATRDDPTCLVPGEPSVELVDDGEDHAPLSDGADIVVQRQYQGAVATVVALQWTGVPGGESLGALSAEVVTDEGDVVASRAFDEAFAPCDAHGGVALHGFEVFYAYGGPMPEVDGLSATLTVASGDLSASVSGVLRVVGQ
jgi:hypothetical protein